MEEDGYEMRWVGKREAYHTAFLPTQKILNPLTEDSKHWDSTGNLLLRGDNLEALRLLRHSYFGKIKLIYIDPPYNTKSDAFIYNDDFSTQQTQILEELGYDKDNIDYIKNIYGAKTHSGWLSFMYPRLLLAKDLLRDDGVIFISIDDNEQAQLKLLCDEVFGEENYLVTHYVQVRYAGKTLAEKNDYQKLIEQVLVYQKSSHTPRKKKDEYSIDKFCWVINEKSKGRTEIMGKRNVTIFSPDEYEIIKSEPSMSNLKETWATGTVLKANASGKYFGTYLANRKAVDGLGFLYKVEGIGDDGIGYRYFTGAKKESATKGKFFSGVPSNRRDEIESTGGSKKDKSIENFYEFSADFGNCRHEGDVDFRSGKKPVAFLKTLIEQAIDPMDDEIILDFFAGSGSTAEAVMRLNAEDGGNRSFILVQIPQAIDPQKQKEAYRFVTEALNKPATIFEITAERLRRAGQKIEAEAAVDTGFRVFDIIADNDALILQKPLSAVTQDDLSIFIQHNTDSDNRERVLYNLLLSEGLPLTTVINELIADTVYLADDVLLILGTVDLTRLTDTLKELNHSATPAVYLTVYAPWVRDDNFMLGLKTLAESLGFSSDKLRLRG